MPAALELDDTTEAPNQHHDPAVAEILTAVNDAMSRAGITGVSATVNLGSSEIVFEGNVDHYDDKRLLIDGVLSICQANRMRMVQDAVRVKAWEEQMKS